MSCPRRLIVAATAAVTTLLSAGCHAATTDDDNYRFDFGALVGMSGYLGDANESNLYAHPGFAGGIQGRYLFNERTALRLQLTGLTLSGNTADMTNVLPGMATYTFSSWVADLGIRGEFNFLPYGIGETYRHLRRVTPFISVGISAILSGCDGQTFFTAGIPMGFGVKYKPSKRWNLMAELTFAKTFGDHIDGPDLSDLTTIKSSFLKNTDWYSTITVGVTYEFGPRCVTCHRVD